MIHIYKQTDTVTGGEVVVVHKETTPLRAKKTCEAMIPVCVENTGIQNVSLEIRKVQSNFVTLTNCNLLCV